jgi:hypothetical protein
VNRPRRDPRRPPGHAGGMDAPGCVPHRLFPIVSSLPLARLAYVGCMLRERLGSVARRNSLGHDRNRRHPPGWPCPAYSAAKQTGSKPIACSATVAEHAAKPCVQRLPPGAQALSTSIVATRHVGAVAECQEEAAIGVWARECMGLPSGCCVRLRIRTRSSRYPRCVAIKSASSLMIIAPPGVGAVHRGVRRGPLALPAGRRAPLRDSNRGRAATCG